MRDMERIYDFVATHVNNKVDFHAALERTWTHFRIPFNEREGLASLIGKNLNERKQFKKRLVKQDQVREAHKQPREPKQIQMPFMASR